MTIDVTVNPRDLKIMPQSELEEIAQNVQMIIGTMRGTVPMDRTFGVNSAFLDYPIAAAQAKLSAEIASAIKIQEPRARLQKVFYSGNPADGQLIISARILIVEKNLRGYI